jgi:hypothetical protein
MNDGERCENCRFWKDMSDDENVHGECRRRPPIVNNLVLRENCDGDDSGFAYDEIRHVTAWCWPMTAPASWCGEWQAKEDV